MRKVDPLAFEDVRISGAGGAVVQLQAEGAATFRNVVASGVVGAGILACVPRFELVDGGGNSDWESRTSSTCTPSAAGQD